MKHCRLLSILFLILAICTTITSERDSGVHSGLVPLFNKNFQVSAQYTGDPGQGDTGETQEDQGDPGDPDQGKGDGQSNFGGGEEAHQNETLSTGTGCTGVCDSGMTQPRVDILESSCDNVDPLLIPAKTSIKLKWDPEPNTSASFFEIWRSDTTTSSTGTGFHTQIYDSKDLTGTDIVTRHDLKSFGTYNNSSTDQTAGIDYNWGNNSPSPGIGTGDVSIRFEGYIKAPVAGAYTFYSSADDGVRCYLDFDRCSSQLAVPAGTAAGHEPRPYGSARSERLQVS